ncbi:hypothetical protein [Methylobacillus flagellatus]|uniref:hypothetical protein n=1 Tax=Methylobacillus flagellatus TaxID=405 RepID=UPI0003218B6C|nr:hypothetical protein [Methylobacillus flagellatus]
MMKKRKVPHHVRFNQVDVGNGVRGGDEIGNIPASNVPERFRELCICIVSGMHFRPEWSSAWPFSMVSQALT